MPDNPIQPFVNPTQECHKERLKESKGTRQTQTPPVYQKHRLLIKYRRSSLPCEIFNGRGILTVQR